MGRTRETEWSGIEGFPDPYGFLNEFQGGGDAPYDELNAFFSRELDLGNEATVRDYIDDRALDIRDQAAYRDLIASFLDIRDSSDLRYKKFAPTADTSIDYLKFRLAVGVMGPAMGIALDRTVPEHTRVRRLRTLTAADMVKGWMDESFADSDSARQLTSLIESDVTAYLRGHFIGEYTSSETQAWPIDEYLEEGYSLPYIDRASDGYKFFDLKDLALRILHVHKGKLPTADEIEELLARSRKFRVTDESFPVARNGHGHLNSVATKIILQEVVGVAFGGLELLTVKDRQIAKRLNGQVPAAERILPGSTLVEQPHIDSTTALEGRAVAGKAALALLVHLQSHGITRSGQTGGRIRLLDKEQKAIVLDRLQHLVRQHGGPWMLADAAFTLAHMDYVEVYGDAPLREE